MIITIKIILASYTSTRSYKLMSEYALRCTVTLSVTKIIKKSSTSKGIILGTNHIKKYSN